MVIVYKETQEDWFPSYMLDDTDTMMVRVSFLGNISDDPANPIWRTCVWGDDDMGMEFDCNNERECWNKFQMVIVQPYVNRDYLKSAGFVAA